MEPVNITNNLGDSRLRTAIADPLGNVHVLWDDNSLYPFTSQLVYRMLDDQRNLTPIVAVPGPTHGGVVFDAVADEQGTVHLLHRSGANLFYNKKPLNNAWTQPVTVTSISGLHSQPRLALGSPDTLHAVWGTYHYMLPPDGTWTEVATDTVDGALAVDTIDVLHRVWAENGDIFYQSYAPNEDRSVPHNLSNTLTPAEGPLIRLGEQGDIHVIWRDLDGPNNYGVFYSAVEGADWSTPVNVTTVERNAGQEYYLELEPDGTPHIVWSYFRAFPDDIHLIYSYTAKQGNGQWIPSEPAAQHFKLSPRGDVHMVNPEARTHSWQYQWTRWPSTPVPFQQVNPPDFELISGGNVGLLGIWRYQNDLFYSYSYPIEIDSVIPQDITNFYASELEIQGNGLFSTSRVYLDELELQNSELMSPTLLRADLPIYLPPANYRIRIENPDGRTKSLSTSIVVTSPTLVITDVTPISIYSYSSVLDIRGSGFFSVTRVFLHPHFYPDDGIDKYELTLGNSTSTLLSTETHAPLTPGYYYLHVATQDERTDVYHEQLEVRHPIPVIKEITPHRVPFRVNTLITLHGDYLFEDVSIKVGDLELIVGQPTSPSEVSVAIPNWLPTGTYSLTVTNYGPGEPSVTIPDAIHVFETSTLYAPVMQTPLDRIEADLPATEME